jgi:hypothetical protein
MAQGGAVSAAAFRLVRSLGLVTCFACAGEDVAELSFEEIIITSKAGADLPALQADMLAGLTQIRLDRVTGFEYSGAHADDCKIAFEAEPGGTLTLAAADNNLVPTGALSLLSHGTEGEAGATCAQALRIHVSSNPSVLSLSLAPEAPRSCNLRFQVSPRWPKTTASYTGRAKDASEEPKVLGKDRENGAEPFVDSTRCESKKTFVGGTWMGFAGRDAVLVLHTGGSDIELWGALKSSRIAGRLREEETVEGDWGMSCDCKANDHFDASGQLSLALATTGGGHALKARVTGLLDGDVACKAPRRDESWWSWTNRRCSPDRSIYLDGWSLLFGVSLVSVGGMVLRFLRRRFFAAKTDLPGKGPLS